MKDSIHTYTKEKKRRGELLFYLSIVTIPVIQFLVFYVGVNLNSFRLAFSKYVEVDSVNHISKYVFVGFDNFKEIIEMFKKDGSIMILATKNSLIVYFCNLIIGTPLALFFSFYIYKKMKFYKFFQVLLFMPSIISSIVLVLIFKYFSNSAYPIIIEALFNKEIPGLLAINSVDTHLKAVITFGIIFSFGANVLLYSGAMSKISPELVESAELDGISHIQEFFYITMPQIFSTFSTFIIVGFAGIFANQASLFSFFGTGAEYKTYTIGYYIYKTIMSPSITNNDYCHLSAVGLFFSIFVVPLSLLLRWIMNKLDPNEV